MFALFVFFYGVKLIWRLERSLGFLIWASVFPYINEEINEIDNNYKKI